MDMLSIGAPKWGSGLQKQAISRGCAPMSLLEETTLFAGWAIASSPLILSFDGESRLSALSGSEVTLESPLCRSGE